MVLGHLRLFVLFFTILICGAPISTRANDLPSALTLPEFGALIRSLSEQGREFHTDNFTSNETSYLHPLPILRKLDLSSGVYIGVGPEQNFTYIGTIRPRLAFIVDIRRNNMLQHLMYKALFAMSDTRAGFLSKLLSKPLYEELPYLSRLFRQQPAWNETGPTIGELIDYFDSVGPVEAQYEKNLAQIKAFVKACGFDALDDMNAVEYIYRAFYQRQLDIRYDHTLPFPGLRELLQETTLEGEQAGFLADERVYRYVKDLQSRNLVVPVVGDFSGDRALRGIAEYVKAHDAAVKVFYTSNVEQYLLIAGYTAFSKYIENVKRFPVDESSIFIRSFVNVGRPQKLTHPNRVGDHPFTTLVQPIAFLLEKKPWKLLWGADLYRHMVTAGNLN